MENKITDKGWAEMSKLLDREMPEKRRRRFGWWWFALLLPVALYGSWQWLKDADAPTSKQDIAIVPPQTFEATPTQPVGTTHTETSSKHFPTTQKPQNIPETTALKTRNTNKGAKIKQQVIQSNLTSGQATPSQAETASQAPLKSSPDNLVWEVPGVSTEPVSITTPQLSLDLLPTTPQSIELSSPKAVADHTKLLAYTPKPANKSFRKTWEFSATSAFSTEQFNALNGFSTGATVDWKFARKWGLRTGLMYSIYTPQEKSRPVASIMPENYASNVDGNVLVLDLITGTEVLNLAGNSTYGDSLTGNVFIPVNRLQRLEIPVTAFWQPSRLIKVLGGFSLTRTLSVQADRQNYSGDYVLKLSDQSAEDGASKLSSSELDNWSADASLGLGIRLSSMFEVGVAARMPLSKFQSLVRADEGGASAGLSSQSVGSTRKQSRPVFSLSGTLFF